MNPAECLPIEILDIIVSQLASSDLCALCCVNWLWRCIVIPKLYDAPCLDTQLRLHQFVLRTCGSMLQQHITVLDLSSVRQYVTDDHLERLRKCTRVRKVNLSNCNNTSSSAIHKLLLLCASNGTTLEAVHLANCHLSTETLGVLGQAHGLRTLDLTNTMIRPCASMDTPHHLETMLGHSAQPLMLEVLNLSYCSWVDDETLQNITNGLPHLRRLELCWCHRVSDATILYLVQNLTRLEMIGLRHLVTVGLQMAWTLLNANSNLTTIDFSNRFKSFRLIRNDSVVTMEDHL